MNLTDIAEIYRIYPRHKDKGCAFKAIDKAIRRLEDGEAGRRLMYADAVLFLLERTQEFASSPAGQRGVYTAYPGTFFNRSSYLDDPKEWQHLNRQEATELRLRMEANVGVFRP